MPDDSLSAALDEIRAHSRWTSSADGIAAPGATAVKSARDVPRLLAALDEGRKLADKWAASAAELDQTAERADARGADPMRTTLMSARAQAHQDCARELREAISRALLGEESSDGK